MFENSCRIYALASTASFLCAAFTSELLSLYSRSKQKSCTIMHAFGSTGAANFDPAAALPPQQLLNHTADASPAPASSVELPMVGVKHDALPALASSKNPLEPVLSPSLALPTVPASKFRWLETLCQADDAYVCLSCSLSQGSACRKKKPCKYILTKGT
jgi:hypothetical protein